MVMLSMFLCGQKLRQKIYLEFQLKDPDKNRDKRFTQ